MEDINATIHQQLKEYAQRLFTATVNAYTAEGKCSLKPGKYSAKEMQRGNFMKIHEINTGHALTPEEINEEVTVTAGEFSATFMYRDIFVILARWEALMKPGKDKAVFEIGDAETISAKVLADEKTELGTYKEKRMKLQRLHGNWYAPARIKNNVYSVDVYYKHNKLIFCGGQMPANSLVKSNRENLIKRLDKVENDLTKSLLDLAERNEYFAEVCKRMNIEAQQPATPAETPQISTETSAVNGEKEPERAENNQNQACYSHHCRVLHNCDLKTWDKFHKKHKDAILVFHYGATYIALQKEAVKVSVLCGTSYTVNRYGVEVCQFDDAALTRVIEQGVYVAIAELTRDPDCGRCDSPQPPKPAPQSTQTAKTINYATPTPKAREIARKRHFRRLGANGYAMLDDAAATLAAINAPQHRAANSPPIGRPP